MSDKKSMAEVVGSLQGARRALFYVALMATNVVLCADFVITPIVNLLYEQFPDSMMGVNFMVSGPYLFVFAASLLMPRLLRFTTKKRLLLMACAVFAVVTIFGAAVVSVPYMIVCRCIYGIANGIVQSVSMALIAEAFDDEVVRAKIMGYYNVALAIFGAVVGYLSGVLAAGGWQHSFWVYWIAVPVVLLVAFFIPDAGGVEKSVDSAATGTDQDAAPAKKESFGWRYWAMLVVQFCTGVCFSSVFMIFISVYIAEQGIGDSTLAGLVTTANNIAGLVGAGLFGNLYARLRARSSLLFIGSITLAILLLYLAPSAPVTLLAAALGGFGYNGQFTYLFAESSVIVAPGLQDKAISYATAFATLAGFLTTYVITGLQGLMGTSQATPTFLVLGLVMVGTCVLEFVRGSGKKQARA